MKARISCVISLFALISLAGSFSSRADSTYHRFWRGVRRAELSPSEFQADLLSVFIPATVATGAGKGMTAYEPVLTEGVPGLPAGFPDEIALVSYRDSKAYSALYSTEEGKAYQALHAKYFDMALSHSLVPVPYIGQLALDQAYDLHPDYAGWMAGRSRLRVSLRRAGESDSRYLARIKTELNQDLAQDRAAAIHDRAVLVAHDYWIEYISAESPAGAGGGIDRVFPLADESAADASIWPGTGINLQF